MNWLALAFALEVGIAPMDQMTMYDPPSIVSAAPVYYQELWARVYLWDHLFLGGSLQAQEWKEADRLGFWPFRTAYELEAGIVFGPLEIGTRRYCTHPSMPFQPLFAMMPEWEATYWQVYLRLEGKIGGK